MLGMLKDHPDLAAFQDPVLLAIGRGRVYVDHELDATSKFKYVAQEWDRFVDVRFMAKGSFKIKFESMVGSQSEGAAQLGSVPVRPVQPYVGDAVGGGFKRMAMEEMGEGEGGKEYSNGKEYRNKRMRKG